MSEASENRAARRRWLNLAELVALAGVLIAGASLWFSYADRRDAAADKLAQASAGTRLELSAMPVGGGLKLADARHDLDEVTITYPAALGVPAQHPAGEPVLEAAPFKDALLKLTDGGADTRSGRLPVLIAASYADGDATRVATGLYDVTWRTQGRFLRGRALTLTGLRLRRHGGTRAALDAAWAREKP
ncbi:hypothetical protein [Sphingomonas bacterium]|uniref:hypothetical protein n=1 Tax=Sphingomonas bacterium TaxID=1895847 RepID=UPI0015776251|nr:hypothetical protein [Sphingomonas bacterium]